MLNGRDTRNERRAASVDSRRTANATVVTIRWQSVNSARYMYILEYGTIIFFRHKRDSQGYTFFFYN